MLGRKKSAILGYLKDRMKERVQRWDKKFLSRGWKELLIKDVAQALTNCFPSAVVHKVGKDNEQILVE